MRILPEESIGYWLFIAQRFAFYAFSEVLRACCIEHGKPYVVTPPQWGVLALLYEHDGLTVGTISQKRKIDPPTITGIVTRLEQSGLVERRRDPTDRRIVNVYITTEGHHITDLLFDAVEAFHKVTVRGFSEAEQHDFREKLQQIIVNVAAVSPGIEERFGLLPGSVPEQID